MAVDPAVGLLFLPDPFQALVELSPGANQERLAPCRILG